MAKAKSLELKLDYDLAPDESADTLAARVVKIKEAIELKEKADEGREKLLGKVEA